LTIKNSSAIIIVGANNDKGEFDMAILSNSGYHNSGYHNSGDRNSGNRNSGDRNSGDCNSGDYNSGNYNSGYRNSGYCNSGNCNSGNHNSGYHNSGYHNSGDYNSGNHNSGNHNSGFFNTNEPNVRLFNQETNLKMDDIKIPNIYLKTTEWIEEENMTSKQKTNDPDFHIKKGTLIIRTYKEAWELYWSEAKDSDKQLFLSLPNFNSEIFKEITGIETKTKTCHNKVVEIDGVKYKLSEIE